MQGFAKRISWLTITTTGKVVIIMSPSLHTTKATERRINYAVWWFDPCWIQFVNPLENERNQDTKQSMYVCICVPGIILMSASRMIMFHFLFFCCKHPIPCDLMMSADKNCNWLSVSVDLALVSTTLLCNHHIEPIKSNHECYRMQQQNSKTPKVTKRASCSRRQQQQTPKWQKIIMLFPQDNTKARRS
jgi:hypothetical protein